MYPNECFFLDENSDSVSLVGSNAESPPPLKVSKTDLSYFTPIYAKSSWYLSGERFSDNGFIKNGALNYYRFLTLKSLAAEQGILLIANNQITLMWQTYYLRWNCTMQIVFVS